ncbi:hypothetical protein F4806DRAFT_16091 [Annulohypoxylon nitens]|nr:hypothetical protein F4806DRAFT_16091 [Annulohypoxylon nitens]
MTPQIDQRVEFHGNRNDGSGDQVLGIKFDLRNCFQGHRKASITGIIAVVGVVLALILTLSLTLGRNEQDSSSSPSSSTSPAPGNVPSGTAATSSTTSQIAPTTTPEPDTCTYGCLKDYLETASCGSGCPGAFCSDNNGCLDPWPCITHICCYTGCQPSWSCSGECSNGLTCVSATAGTAESTCQA